jgi:translation initiation factor IF-3
MTLAEAREVARKQMLDLVEVAPTSVPPVCRLLDYGKFKYEQAKKEQQARRNQRVSLLREVRLRPKIGLHDFEAKARTARKLLKEGDKVKLTLMFRGRESTHPELGWKVLQRMVESLSDIATLERQPVMEGRRMNIVLAPAIARTPASAGSKATAQAPATGKTPAAASTQVKAKEEIKEVQHAEAKNA